MDVTVKANRAVFKPQLQWAAAADSVGVVTDAVWELSRCGL